MKRIPRSGRRISVVHAATALSLVVMNSACSAASDAPTVAAGEAVLDVASFVLADVPTLSIGGSDTRSEYQLAYTLRALRLPKGQIVIGDRGDNTLRYFDERGEFIRRVGGNGQGPGEFQRLTSITRMADGSVAATDRNANRLTFFSDTGDLLSTVPLPHLEALGGGSGGSKFFVFPQDVLPLANGRFAAVLTGEPNVNLIPEGPYLIQDSLPIYLGDQSSTEWREVEGGRYPGNLWYFFNRSGRLFPAYYGERLEYAGGDSVFYVAPTRSATILRVSASTGEVEDFVRLPGSPRPFTDADGEDLRARMTGPPNPPGAFEAMKLPAELPRLFDLLVDAEGDLWVQLFQSRVDSVATWIMYDQEGVATGQLTVPANFKIVDAGDDYILALTSDELDQETVHLYAIRRKPD